MGVFDDLSFASEVFATYDVELSFQTPNHFGEMRPTKLMGGVPKNPDIVKGWLRSKAGVKQEDELAHFMYRSMQENGLPLERSGDELALMEPTEIYEEIDAVAGEYADQNTTQGFKTGEYGLYIESRYIKSMLKESTNILFAKQRWGKTGKGPVGFVAERVFPVGDEIWLPSHEPDGVEPWIGHPKDQHGTRGIFALHEYFVGPTVQFQLEVLAGAEKDLDRDTWAKIWLHAQRNGIGALRSQGFGRFDTTRFERVA